MVFQPYWGIYQSLSRKKHIFFRHKTTCICYRGIRREHPDNQDLLLSPHLHTGYDWPVIQKPHLSLLSLLVRFTHLIYMRWNQSNSKGLTSNLYKLRTRYRGWRLQSYVEADFCAAIQTVKELWLNPSSEEPANLTFYARTWSQIHLAHPKPEAHKDRKVWLFFAQSGTQLRDFPAQWPACIVEAHPETALHASVLANKLPSSPFHSCESQGQNSSQSPANQPPSQSLVPGVTISDIFFTSCFYSPMSIFPNFKINC